jgi:cytochrome c oxidase subunit 2
MSGHAVGPRFGRRGARAAVAIAGVLASLRCAIAADAPLHDVLQPAGPQAGHIHALWLLLLGVCSVVFVAVIAALIVALRRAPRATATTPADTGALMRDERSTRRVVATAVGVSAVLLVALFGATVVVDRALAQLPLADALHITLTGHQWWWEATYDDPQPANVFSTANELHIPVGRPVILSLEASDVIHSIWVPNLHGKKDLIPGRTATLALRADAPGTYAGECAEFCGYQHAKMTLLIVAEPAAGYAQWVARARAPATPPADAAALRGQQVFLQASCALCHAIGGTPANGRQAPDLTHVASRQRLAAGALPNEPSALAAWIADPQHIKPGAKMPAHALAPADMQALLAYLGSLR